MSLPVGFQLTSLPISPECPPLDGVPAIIAARLSRLDGEIEAQVDERSLFLFGEREQAPIDMLLSIAECSLESARPLTAS